MPSSKLTLDDEYIIREETDLDIRLEKERNSKDGFFFNKVKLEPKFDLNPSSTPTEADLTFKYGTKK
jgi:hypothetical protein